MRLGFTGSRQGMTARQYQALSVLMEKAESLAHGDCEGADESAHNIAIGQDVPIFIHPPLTNSHRAFCKGAVHVYPRLKYLERNRCIVLACDLLVAAPDGPERLRSGTWATVRFARKVGKPVVVLDP